MFATQGAPGGHAASQSLQPTLQERLHWFEYDAKAPLDLHEKEVTRQAGASVHDISYASPRGGRATGYLVVPEGKGPFAGIVFMHWGQGDRSEFLAEALLLTRAGAVSVMIDAPFLRPDSPVFKMAPGAERERSIYAQMVVDLRRAVDLLLTRPNVDAKRIGYVGHSLGATWGAPLLAADKRFKAAVLMGGLPELSNLEILTPEMRQPLEEMGRDKLEEYRRILSVIEPVHLAAHTAPVPVFFQFAYVDRYITEAAAREYFSAAGEPKTQKWYYCSHEFNDLESLRDRGQFLEEHLKLAPVLPLLRQEVTAPR